MSAEGPIGIVGAGAFGSALATVLAAGANAPVILWGRSAAPGDADGVGRTTDPTDLRAAAIVLFVVPAQTTDDVAARLAPMLSPQSVVACAKGIDAASGRRQSEVLGRHFPEATVAALSGPGFAEEIAAGLPTALALGCTDADAGLALARRLSTPTLRLYAQTDLIGVELGGAVKNVLAIAAGVVVGRGLGESARAAVVTRGLAEMARLGQAVGARVETFAGLSGLGDLVLTATSGTSRNMRFGLALGRGEDPTEAARGPLVEGATTAAAVVRLARAAGIEMPIATAVAEIVAGRATIDEAIVRLLQRPLGSEG